ncbi:MAG: lipid A deacylase LpxR family protein [Rhodospirillales bacterium]|nr:lipid A deacylase LpxR family protein [Rhodospirillales bacterium]
MLILPHHAVAEDSDWTVSFQVENDFFAGLTDRHFTNGLSVTGLVEKTVFNDWAKYLGPQFPTIKHQDIDAVIVGLGQNMFSPEDISSSAAITDDRPYAGWLYGTLGILAEEDDPRTGGSTLKTLSLDVGVTGPLSLGENVQKFWHKTFGLQNPNGWDHQIKNELGVVLNFDYKKRIPLDWSTKFFELDFSPHAGFALGNIYTYGNGGGVFRLGKNLNLDYGPPRIRPSLPGSGLVRRKGEYGWYLFAGFDGRAVARNIFLDGNTFAESHHVKRRPLVGDLQGGFAITLDRLRLSATYVLRTKEFERQNGADRFGALSMTVIF